MKQFLGGFSRGRGLGFWVVLTAFCFGQAAATAAPLIGRDRLSAANPEQGFAVIGDAGVWNDNTRSVRDSILRSGIRRLVMPGDNIYNPFSTYDREWSPWKTAGFLFEAVAIGNHNLGYDRETAYFDMPGEVYAQVLPGVARFLILNSDSRDSVDQQAAWFREQLRAAQEPAVFAVYHHPPVSLTSMHGWKEREDFQKKTRPLLFEYRNRLTGVLVGHDHLAGLYDIDGLPVILSGATHELRGIERAKENQAGHAVKTQWVFDGKPTWVRLKLQSAGGAWQADFVRAADDRVSCSVQLSSGRPGTPSADCSRGF